MSAPSQTGDLIASVDAVARTGGGVPEMNMAVVRAIARLRGGYGTKDTKKQQRRILRISQANFKRRPFAAAPKRIP
jgi:hypothetical protein